MKCLKHHFAFLRPNMSSRLQPPDHVCLCYSPPCHFLCQYVSQTQNFVLADFSLFLPWHVETFHRVLVLVHSVVAAVCQTNFKYPMNGYYFLHANLNWISRFTRHFKTFSHDSKGILWRSFYSFWSFLFSKLLTQDLSSAVDLKTHELMNGGPRNILWGETWSFCQANFRAISYGSQTTKLYL